MEQVQKSPKIAQQLGIQIKQLETTKEKRNKNE